MTKKKFVWTRGKIILVTGFILTISVIIGMLYLNGYISADVATRSDTQDKYKKLLLTMLGTKIHEYKNNYKEYPEGSFIYYRDDHCGGSKEVYSWYTKLTSPSSVDTQAIADPTIKCNQEAKKLGMNFREGNSYESLEIDKAVFNPSSLTIAIGETASVKVEALDTTGTKIIKEVTYDWGVKADGVAKISIDAAHTSVQITGNKAGETQLEVKATYKEKIVSASLSILVKSTETSQSETSQSDEQESQGSTQELFEGPFSITFLPVQYQDARQFQLVNGWNSISIPYLYNKKNSDQSGFLGLAASRTPLYYYDNGWKRVDTKGNNALGRGYYIYSPYNNLLAQLANLDDLYFLNSAAAERYFRITLEKNENGWNLVGNPLYKDITLDNIEVEYEGQRVSFKDAGKWINNQPTGELGVIVMANGDYREKNKLYSVQTIKLKQGFWVKTYTDNVKLVIK